MGLRHSTLSGSEVEKAHVVTQLDAYHSSSASFESKSKGKDVKRRQYTCAIGLRELMGLLACCSLALSSLSASPESASSGMNCVTTSLLASVTERARVIHLRSQA